MNYRIFRLAAICLLVLSLLPVAITGLTHTDSLTEGGVETDDSSNNTVFTCQGTRSGGGDGLFVVNHETNEIVAKHTSFQRKYYDVDPIDKNTVLVVAKVHKYNGSVWPWYAVRLNWRTGNTTRLFAVPPDTHDIDAIGKGRYVIADPGHWGKAITNNWNDKQGEWKQQSGIESVTRQGWAEVNMRNPGNAIYIYNRTSNKIEWTYRFPNHHSPTEGDGLHDDYTHVNDVDYFGVGEILVSPREFDRVLLLNQSSKDEIWTLGQEDNRTVIYEQHNPVLLSRNPATVLVADSENGRVIEYERGATGWKETWAYSEGLGWPRDADRLPNGNTLIVGSRTKILKEVRPNKSVAWKFDASEFCHGPYDIERVQYGDEPRGPTTSSIRENNTYGNITDNEPISEGDYGSTLIEYWKDFYFLSKWILPLWVSMREFLWLNVSVIISLTWMVGEMYAKLMK